MLNTIDKGETSQAHPTPLLFVHGAWHGAWCWDEHFLDFFGDRGYRAIAINLRAHGDRPSDKVLHKLSVIDYVQDVAAIVDALSSPPVLIGHSMGGLIVQHVLQAREAPAGVLLAALPPHGIRPALKRWMKQEPAGSLRSMFTGRSIDLLKTPDQVRLKMFSPNTPDDVVVACTKRLQNETRRMTPDGLFRLPKPALVNTPLLVLGAELDDCFMPDEIHSTAEAYRTRAVIVPGMGHDMMLEPGWQDVAEHIDGWLVGRDL